MREEGSPIEATISLNEFLVETSQTASSLRTGPLTEGEPIQPHREKVLFIRAWHSSNKISRSH